MSILKLSTMIWFWFSSKPFHLSQIPAEGEIAVRLQAILQNLTSFFFASSFETGSHSKKKFAGIRAPTMPPALARHRCSQACRSVR